VRERVLSGGGGDRVRNDIYIASLRRRVVLCLMPREGGGLPTAEQKREDAKRPTAEQKREDGMLKETYGVNEERYGQLWVRSCYSAQG